MDKTQIFLDCDGVLADFDTFITPYLGGGNRADWDHLSNADFWGKLEQIDNLFGGLDKMPDADDLVSGVETLCKQYDLPAPIILTGKPRLDKYKDQKLGWRDKYFPHLEMIVCESKNKRKHMRNPGDVLIDDWTKHMQAWIDVGGQWILHTSAEQSLKELKDYLSERNKSERPRRLQEGTA
jgi:hypothetical protein